MMFHISEDDAGDPEEAIEAEECKNELEREASDKLLLHTDPPKKTGEEREDKESPETEPPHRKHSKARVSREFTDNSELPTPKSSPTPERISEPQADDLDAPLFRNRGEREAL